MGSLLPLTAILVRRLFDHHPCIIGLHYKLRVFTFVLTILNNYSNDLGFESTLISLKFFHMMLKKQNHKSLQVSSHETAAFTSFKSSHASLSPGLDTYIVDTQSYQSHLNEIESIRDTQQEVKQEQVNIVSLNHWKSQSSKKRQNYSQQSFTKLLNKGRVVQEDDKTDNHLFPTPHINQKLIHSICDDLYDSKQEFWDAPVEVEPIEDSKQKRRHSQLHIIQKLQNDNFIRPKETQEVQRKNTNQKLVNKILFNKLSKNLCNQNQAKNATSEVLNSFKSLTSMFKTVHQLINYDEIYNQIIQQQKMPNRMLILTKEFDKDLERQQQNFNDIVQNKLRIVKDQNLECKEKKQRLKDLRTENCLLRDQIKAIFQQVEDRRKDYKKALITIMNDPKADKKRQMQKILRRQQEEENNQLMSDTARLRSDLELNTAQINELESVYADLHEQKTTSRQELAEFLRTVLKNEDIQIQESLVSIIRLLTQIKTNIAMADFPNFLDLHSRNYMLQRSQMELDLEAMKWQVKILGQNINNYETTEHRAVKNQGNRPFFEFKMKQIKAAFNEMKNENRSVKLQRETISSNKFIDVVNSDRFGKKDLQKLQPSPKGEDVQKLADIKFKQHELEEVLDRLEKTEIQRLKNLTQQKQLGMSQIQRLVKTVQAEFGAKRMNKILMDVFLDSQDPAATHVIQVSNMKDGDKHQSEEKDNVFYYRTQQQKLRNSYNNMPDINYNYDPIYNQIPKLQNRYSNSTFFPKR